MNAFNEQVLRKDMELASATGLMESCDVCNSLIHNWDCIGDMSFLDNDGVTILCMGCWNNKRKQALIQLTNIKSQVS